MTIIIIVIKMVKKVQNSKMFYVTFIFIENKRFVCYLLMVLCWCEKEICGTFRETGIHPMGIWPRGRASDS